MPVSKGVVRGPARLAIREALKTKNNRIGPDAGQHAKPEPRTAARRKTDREVARVARDESRRSI